MRSSPVLLLLALVFAAAAVRAAPFHRFAKVQPGAPDETALDRYIAKPDASYKWELNSTFRSDIFGYTAYVLELTSQTWLTPADSNGYLWKHWLTVCVPDEGAESEQAALWIDGGETHDKPPTSFTGGADLPGEAVCVGSHAISAVLKDIPNEPITFTGDWKHKRRMEDAVIAYTWSHFINNTAEPDWLLRLPMVKATVKALDAIQEFSSKFLSTKLPNGPPKTFVIAGASKRGWVTWLMGAVDTRVVGIVPMVMPILNIQPNINAQVMAYGEWSFALDDYLNENLMYYLNEPVFQKLAAIVDPFTYIKRMTMPKLILTACGDEFFLPDSPRFFIDSLVGEWWMTVIPDAEHSLATAYIEVGETLVSFFHLMRYPTIPRPVMNWKMLYSNITGKTVLTLDHAIGHALMPKAVTQYTAYTLSKTQRDFRLVVCAKIPECLNPVIWWPTEIEGVPVNGTSLYEYTGYLDKPQYGGWGGFVVTAEFEIPGLPNSLLHLSTQVNVVPDVFPFRPCYEDKNPQTCCQNPQSCENLKNKW